ncbi:MAG: aminoacyl-tRNA hydrolase [Deltaproteobacteria bacterium]|nr:MAG: aminoacyl-tRNA hydrolase [Deltaproteobacteria bacterium]
MRVFVARARQALEAVSMARDVVLPEGRVVIAGLGNPGAQYDGTRHNIGADVVEALGARHGIALVEQKFRGRFGTGLIGGRSVALLCPQTYMNRSGESVGPALNFWKLGVGSLIVVHDELDLPLGRVRVKHGGGHGGHNGLRSIHVQLPDPGYFRVRLGIDRPPQGGNVSGWVLGRFGAGELAGVEDLHERGMKAVELLLSDGLLHAQNEVHPL